MRVRVRVRVRARVRVRVRVCICVYICTEMCPPLWCVYGCVRLAPCLFSHVYLWSRMALFPPLQNWGARSDWFVLAC